MALLLAPYNDAMRLGMGFNSYTQTMCINGAVTIPRDKNTTVEESSQAVKTPSQVVTYSSKFVERLSDIVSSLNISCSSAIRKGTIEISGNGNSIDEDKIKASDINLVISVQVINQTTTTEDTAEFKPIEGISFDSPRFGETFGDCYISGWIEGGDFTSIISMRCLDRSKANSTIRSIKKMVKANSQPQQFSMDSFALSDSMSGSNALKETETTISVNWMGGGQIKDPKASWDIDAVYEAAAAFPSYVAKAPKKTWAILTKYKANRRFNELNKNRLTTLEYDSVTSYTAELFNNFMEYKQLVKKVQNIIAHPLSYKKVGKDNEINVDIDTLVSVRSALRNEMNKIVTVVNLISKNPQVLSQTDSFAFVSKDATVQNIINRALTKSSDSRIIHDTKVPLSPASDKPATPASGSSTDASFEEVKHAAAQKSPPPVPRKGSEIKLGDLIAPEVWAELLPKQIDPLPIDVVDNGAQAAAGTIITAPPPNDAVRFLDQTPPSKNLKILAAVCGVHDVTHVLQDRVRSDNTLSIPIKEISKLAESPVYDEIKKPFGMSLAFVYQIGNGPMRIRAAQFDGSSSVSVDVPNSPDDALVTPRQWSPETLSIASVVYGGVVFNSESILESIEKKVRDNYNKTAPRYHRVTIDSALVSPDPWKDVYKTGVVFFRAVKDGPIRAAVALESKDILLTDLSLLAVIHKEVIKEVEPPVPSNSKLRTNRIRLVGPPSAKVMFEPENFRVYPSDTSFLEFETGVKFTFDPSGNFTIRDRNGTLWEIPPQQRKGANLLIYQGDGVLCTKDASDAIIWKAPVAVVTGQLILSQSKPYLELKSVFGGEGFDGFKAVA